MIKRLFKKFIQYINYLHWLKGCKEFEKEQVCWLKNTDCQSK